MPYHRLKLEIAGQTMHGLAFGSEAELEAFLAGRDLAPITPLPLTPPASERTVRPRGRPSFDDVLTRAVRDLGPRIDPCATLAERARIVLRHLAETVTDAASIPKRRAVEVYLAASTSRNKSRRKSRKKSARATMGCTGGRKC